MDLFDVFSNDSQDNQNSEGRQTISTDVERKTAIQTLKTKNIKKYYEPIHEAGKVYKYQDNPAQYKRLRKKIQNRESATRVRGRKKNAFENLQQQVQYVRKQNSQLQLANAKLETENKALREQIEFMKGLIKPIDEKKDSIDQYLAQEVLMDSHSLSPKTMEDDYESPFEQPFWLRSSSQVSGSYGWMSLAIFTIVLAVFVIPSDTSPSNVMVALQVGISAVQSTSAVEQIIKFISVNLFGYGKVLIKYLVVFAYLWILYGMGSAYIKRRKLKKI